TTGRWLYQRTCASLWPEAGTRLPSLDSTQYVLSYATLTWRVILATLTQPRAART
ncbi:hypothetical protein GGF43_005808, partial [Coemansia sp. RSA 2618]